MDSFLNPTCKSRVNSTPPCPFTPSSSWQNQGVFDITPQIPTSGIVVSKFSPQDPYQIAQAILTAENSLKCVRAVGSGWSYSDAVIPEAPGSRDTGFIIDSTAFAQPLDSKLAQILAPSEDPGSLAFVEAGMTLKALNEWLDGNNPSRALPTMGGSAGQTIGGLISTGSHGGDWDRPPIADSVQAVYLVGAGGLHFWIERATPVTDRAKLTALFPCLDIRYDQALFDAVLVSMGAMGVIYAVLLKVVPQYSLLEWNYWGDWDDMSPAARAPNGLQDLASGTFSQMFEWLPQLIPADVLGPNPTSRFLQIVVNPFLNTDGGHTCLLTNRLQLPAGWHEGTPPGQLDPNAISASLMAALAGDPRLDFGDAVLADFALMLGIGGSGGANENIVTQLVDNDDKYGPFVLDDAVTLIMGAMYPLPPADYTQYPAKLLWPYVDTGYKVMTGNGGSANPGGIPWTSTGGILRVS